MRHDTPRIYGAAHESSSQTAGADISRGQQTACATDGRTSFGRPDKPTGRPI